MLCDALGFDVSLYVPDFLITGDKMKKIVALLIMFSVTLPAFAEEHVVKMLNSGKDGMMVFEPGVLSVNLSLIHI